MSCATIGCFSNRKEQALYVPTWGLYVWRIFQNQSITFPENHPVTTIGGGGIKVDKSNYWREIFCWNTWSILKNAGEILDGIFLFTIFHENSCQVSTFRPVIIPFNILPSTGGMQLCDQEERWGKKMMPSAPDQFGSFFCRPPPWGGGSGQNPIATSHPWMCG